MFQKMQRRYCEIRLYSSSDNIELGKQMLDGEFVIMTALCGAFYILYTSRGQLNIFSAKTTMLVCTNIMFLILILDKERSHC